MSKSPIEIDLSVLLSGTKGMNLSLSGEQVDQFGRYQALLLEWNQRFNLTAVRDPQQIQQRHFLDSLICSKATDDLNGRSLIDVGTGPGFPGLPLRILFPDLRLTLVESIGKKTTFLQAVVDELQLSGVQVITARAEEIGQNENHRQVYNWAAARAVAPLGVLAEYLLPLVRMGGHALAQKGRHAVEEMRESEDGISILGGGLPRLKSVQLLGREEPSNLVLIEKINPTPGKYPRRVGIPLKRPL